MDDRDTGLSYLANMQRRRTPAEQEPEPQAPARTSSLDLFRAGLRTGYDAPGLSEATESAIALPAPERARLQRQRGTQASSLDLFRAGMRTGRDAPGLSRETQRAVASRTPAPLPTPEPPTPTPTPAPAQGAAESASVSADTPQPSMGAEGMGPIMRRYYGVAENLPTTEASPILTPALGDEDYFYAGWSNRDSWREWWQGKPGTFVESIRDPLFDVDKARRDMAQLEIQDRIRQARDSGNPLSPTEEAQLRIDVYNEVHAEIRGWLDHNRDNMSAFVVDSDPEGTTQALSERGTFTPKLLAAWFKPYSHAITVPRQVTLPDGTVTVQSQERSVYDRQGSWGVMNWLFQSPLMAPITTSVATAVAAGEEIEQRERRAAERAGEEYKTSAPIFRTVLPQAGDIPILNVFDDLARGWRTAEQIDNIRSGEEMITYAEDIGAYMPNLGAIPAVVRAAGLADDAESVERVSNMLRGAGVSLITAIFEPSVFKFVPVVAGVSAVGRIASTALTARKAVRIADGLEQTLDQMRALDATMTQTAQAARAPGAPSPGAGDIPTQLPGRTARPATARTDIGDYADAEVSTKQVLESVPAEVRVLVDADFRLRYPHNEHMGGAVRNIVQRAQRAEDKLLATYESYARGEDAAGSAVRGLDASVQAQAQALRSQAQATPQPRRKAQLLNRAINLQASVVRVAPPNAPLGVLNRGVPYFTMVPSMAYPTVARTLGKRQRTNLAAQEFNALRLRNLADAHIMGDAEAALDAMRRQVGTGLLRGQPVKGAARTAVEAAVKRSWTNLSRARVAMAKANTPAGRRAANARLLRAQDDFARASKNAVEALGNEGLRTMQDIVTTTRGAFRTSSKMLDDLVAQIKVAERGGGNATISRADFVRLLDPAASAGTQARGVQRLLDSHKTATKALTLARKTDKGSRASDMHHARNIVRTYISVLEDKVKAYRTLAQVMKTERRIPGGVTADDIRAAVREAGLDFDPNTAEMLISPQNARGIRSALSNLLGTETVLRAAEAQTTLNLIRTLDDVIATGQTARLPANFLETSVSRLSALSATIARKNLAPALAGQRLASELKLSINRVSNIGLVQGAYETVMKLLRSAADVAAPARSVFGSTNDNVMQISKGAVDAVNRGLADCETAFEAGIAFARENGVSAGQGIRQASVRLADGANATVNGQPVAVPAMKGAISYNANTGTMWESARAFFINAFRKDASGNIQLEDTAAGLRALSRMWLPRGYDNEAVAEGLLKAAFEVMKGNKGQSFEDFARAMLTKTANKTGLPLADLAADTGRAYGMGVQGVMQGAVLNRASQKLAAEVFGFTPKTLESLTRIVDGHPSAATTGSFAELSSLLDRLGVPLGIRQKVDDLGNTVSAGLIMVQKGDTTEAALIPRQLMEAVDKAMPPIIKETQAFATEKPNALRDYIIEPVLKLMRLWRMTWTSGVAYISPRYLTSMVMGSHSQVFVDPLSSVSISGRNMAQHATDLGGMAYQKLHGEWQSLGLPSLNGRLAPVTNALASIRQGMVQRFGQNRVLGGMLESMINPHIANFFDSAKVPNTAPIRLSDGTMVTMGYLRSEALKEGVLSTYASSDLMQLLSRSSSRVFGRDVYEPFATFKGAYEGFKTGGLKGAAQEGARRFTGSVRAMAQLTGAVPGLKYLERRGSIIAEMADTVEQRQRAALFLDLVVNQGQSPAQAGRLVREALYDWGHALSRFEADYINNIVLFWRFYKVSTMQAARVLLDGPFRNYDGTMPRSVSEVMSNLYQPAYSYGLGRASILSAGLRAAREYTDLDQELNHYQSERDRMNALLYEDWTTNRGTPNIGNRPLTEAEASVREELYGRRDTYLTRTLPQVTFFDSGAMLLNMFGSIVRISQNPSGRQLVHESETFTKSLIDRAPPGVAQAMEGVHKSLFPEQAMRFPTRSMRVKPTEKWLFNTIGLDMYSMEGTAVSDEDPESTRRVPTSLLLAFRSIPIISTEMPYWLDPVITARPIAESRVGQFEENRQSRVLGETLRIMATQYTSILKEYASNPARSRELKTKMLTLQNQARINELERRRYAQD